MGWGLLALGLVLLVEGLIWALFPGLIEDLLRQMQALPAQARRLAGLLGATIGAALIWAAFQLGGVEF